MRKITFYKNIKIIRSKYCLTQENLANIANVTRQTVSAWEKGLAIPTIDIVDKLSKHFLLTTDELIYGTIKDVSTNEELPEDDTMNYLKSLTFEKGYHVICDEDIRALGAWLTFDFPFIMGIVMSLVEQNFEIKDVFGNGFGIYLPNDDEAKRFTKYMDTMIDKYIHAEEQVLNKYTSQYEDRVWIIQHQIIEEIKKAALKDDYDKEYFWMDEFENIRGYGNSSEECKAQAYNQQCNSFSILKNN